MNPIKHIFLMVLILMLGASWAGANPVESKIKIEFEFAPQMHFNEDAPSNLKVVQMPTQNVLHEWSREALKGQTKLIWDVPPARALELKKGLILKGKLFYCLKGNSKICKVKVIKDLPLSFDTLSKINLD